jgi:hypothetical protein
MPLTKELDSPNAQTGKRKTVLYTLRGWSGAGDYIGLYAGRNPFRKPDAP